MRAQNIRVLAFAVAATGTSLTHAHVSISGTPSVPVANKTYEAVFNVPHGCSDSEGRAFDTYQVEIQIPDSVTNVRPADSTFGNATVVKNEAGVITSIIWNKAEGAELPADDHFYKFTVRGKLPDAPFTTVYFPTIQRCHGVDNAELTAEWTATDGGEHDHAAAATEESPAPSIFVYPARNAGWNQYTVTEHVHDLSVFADAEIVWAGTAAYSPNPNTTALIQAEEDVTVLDAIHPGTQIWVKY